MSGLLLSVRNGGLRVPSLGFLLLRTGTSLCMYSCRSLAKARVKKRFDNNGDFQKHLHMKSPSVLMAVFGFSLFHCFGLSTRLQQLPLGDDSTSMLSRSR